MTIMRRSYCSTRITVDRQFEGEELKFLKSESDDLGKCDASQLLTHDDLSFQDEISLQFPKSVLYCVAATNSAMNYATEPTSANGGCVSVKIEFFTTMYGAVTAAGGSSTPIPNVRIDYEVAGVSGHVITDALGEYSITLQIASVEEKQVAAELRPSLSNGGIEHIFSCE
eukprot:4115404-Pleurochrysis_carterae.AAC.1